MSDSKLTHSINNMNVTAFPYAYFLDQITPIEKANVSIMTNALQYGTGWFAGVRGYMQEDETLGIFRLDDHVERFMQSSKVLGVKLDHNSQKIKDAIIALTKKNKPTTDVYYRPFAYAHLTNLTPSLAENHTFTFSLYMIPLGDYIPTDRGNKVCVSSWTRIDDTMIPPRAKVAGGYINSALAKQEAVNKGYDEAIFLNVRGRVCEGSSMNIFLVRDGVLITPAVNEGILEGITRRSIITIARELGITVEERAVERTELYVADEVFFSGTGAQVAWVQEVDNRVVGKNKIGPITQKLQKIFFDVVRGKNKKYAHWISVVK